MSRSKRARAPEANNFVRTDVLARTARIFQILFVVALIALLLIFIGITQRNRALADAPSTRAPTKNAVAVLNPNAPLIALVAGHSGGIDTGAICADGTREVDVTTDVARRAKNNLEARNYRVEILAEFDARLNAATREYSPRAFLAIHADSCIFSASGFKVARAEISAIPQEEDRMVRCLIAAYADATLLRYHADSITRDMTHYHALGEINLQSPAAIIELGFLGSDAETLKKRDLLAQGVADGLDSFLKGNECK